MVKRKLLDDARGETNPNFGELHSFSGQMRLMGDFHGKRGEGG
jgi:hypothetical protein